MPLCGDSKGVEGRGGISIPITITVIMVIGFGRAGGWISGVGRGIKVMRGGEMAGAAGSPSAGSPKWVSFPVCVRFSGS